MASFTLPARSASRLSFKAVLWIFLGVTTLFVFITSEVLLFIDYPMYHAYRLQVIADRGLLIPHALCGTVALLAGPAVLVAPSAMSPEAPSRRRSARTSSPSLSAPLPGSPLLSDVPGCLGPPCKPPHGSSALPLP